MTTTSADLTGTWQPGAAFVVACPACLGQLGVAGRLAGQLACCPLCAATFHVPHPERPDAPPPPLASVAAVPRHPVRHVTASASTVTAWSPQSQPASPTAPAAWHTSPLVLPPQPAAPVSALPPTHAAVPESAAQEPSTHPDAVAALPAQAPVFGSRSRGRGRAGPSAASVPRAGAVRGPARTRKGASSAIPPGTPRAPWPPQYRHASRGRGGPARARARDQHAGPASRSDKPAAGHRLSPMTSKSSASRKASVEAKIRAIAARWIFILVPPTPSAP